jgi:hypothetical protein
LAQLLNLRGIILRQVVHDLINVLDILSLRQELLLLKLFPPLKQELEHWSKLPRKLVLLRFMSKLLNHLLVNFHQVVITGRKVTKLITVEYHGLEILDCFRKALGCEFLKLTIAVLDCHHQHLGNHLCNLALVHIALAC